MLVNHTRKHFYRHLVTIGFALILSMYFYGCATVDPLKETKKQLPQEFVTKEKRKEPERPADGSLWRNTGMMNNLFVTPKAKNIGDIVTIKIVESAKASNNAKTNTGRKSSLSASIDKLLGLENQYTNSKNPKFNEFANFNPFGKIEGSMKSKFDGSGATNRSGDLSAYITARVTHVLSNGNLVISGYREITVNYEKQLITLSGIIRPTDIAANNVILSTYISDARIVYSGKGIIQKRQRPGWFANILNTIWPF